MLSELLSSYRRQTKKRNLLCFCQRGESRVVVRQDDSYTVVIEAAFPFPISREFRNHNNILIDWFRPYHRPWGPSNNPVIASTHA
jgi:hypothetical protein